MRITQCPARHLKQKRSQGGRWISRFTHCQFQLAFPQRFLCIEKARLPWQTRLTRTQQQNRQRQRFLLQQQVQPLPLVLGKLAKPGMHCSHVLRILCRPVHFLLYGLVWQRWCAFRCRVPCLRGQVSLGANLCVCRTVKPGRQPIALMRRQCSQQPGPVGQGEPLEEPGGSLCIGGQSIGHWIIRSIVGLIIRSMPNRSPNRSAAAFDSA
ncbi:MAG: hypothetical protein ACRYGK_11525 [Janthinobacterium lividum]